MKKILTIAAISLFFVSEVSADALKDSLTKMMHKNDSPPMVDLGYINLDAKPKVKKVTPKHRAPNTVIGTINGHKIIKKDADAYLKKRTQGKVSNCDALAKKQQKMLIQEMGLSYIIYDAAKKELTKEEKESILNRVWMQKEAKKLKIKEDDIRAFYKQLKQQAIENKETRTIPSFDTIKQRLYMQMVEKRVMDILMKDLKIEITD